MSNTPTVVGLSLGAGVQSTTCLILSAEGILPKIDFAAFADTGMEPRAVYENLDRLEREVARPAGIEIVRVKQGDIRDDALDPYAGHYAQMPLYIRGRDGRPHMMRRACTVICTFLSSMMAVLVTATKESGVDLRRELMEGRAQLPRVGYVVATGEAHPPYLVLNGYGAAIEPVTAYLRDLALSDSSPLTPRSYGFGLLRWFRLLWLLDVGWDRAAEAEVAVLTGWLRTAPNPQRRRRDLQSAPPGTVNPRTGKPYLGAGYAPSTINHALSVVSGFYSFHAHEGRGPVVNPVPVSPQRRRALGHLSPLEPKPVLGRARLRQKVTSRPPRSIPDPLWDELFAAMGCERDRALLDCYVTSGARAEELLGVTTADIHWAKPGLYVISKGTRERELVPISPEACVRLAHYLDDAGLPTAGEPVWRTRHGKDRPLTYWATRRVIQRAQQELGTNWTLHDLRHTAAHRMANGGKLTLPEVQAVLRHANIQTTSRYLAVRVEEIFDALLEHYNRPRPQVSYPTGYAADDIAAVFGA